MKPRITPVPVRRVRETVRATGGDAVGVREKADELLRIARAHREKDPAHAAAAAAEAIRISRSCGYETGVAWGCADLAYCMSLQGRPLEAFTDSKEALLLFRKMGDEPGEARALYMIATCYYHLSQWRRAQQNYDKSLAISVKLGDAEQAFATRVALNSLRNAMGDYHGALADCQVTIPVARARGHTQYLMASLTDRGFAWLQLGRHREAAQAHRAVLQIAERTNNPTRQALALCNLGDVAQESHRYRQAAEYYREAETWSAAVANPIFYALSQYGQGAALTELGEFAQARAALTACLRAGRRHRRPDSVALAWLGFSALYLKRGEPEKSLRAARRAAEIAAVTGNKSYQEEARKRIAAATRASARARIRSG